MGRHETQERNTIVFGNDVLPISLHSSITVDSPSVSSLSRRGSARASARSIWMSLWRGKRWLALAPSWFRVFTRHSISKRQFWWSKTSQRRTEKRFTETSSTVNICVHTVLRAVVSPYNRLAICKKVDLLQGSNGPTILPNATQYSNFSSVSCLPPLLSM